jgi:hypothetical protein
MSRYLKVVCVILFALLPAVAYTQVDQKILDMVKLNQSPSIPNNILSSRSIVLISLPKEASNSEWRDMAGEMQFFFAEAGIDAVAYFSIDELSENVEAQKGLAKNIFAKRGVTNVITLTVLGEESLFFTIGPYNLKWTFFDTQKSYWMRESNDVENIWSEMRTIFKAGAHKRNNILVLDSPEFFDLTIPYKTRTERFTKVMETQKVAVPMYVSIKNDPNIALRFKADLLNGSENRDSTSTQLLNDKLTSIIAQYPFEAELVNINEKSEDEWLRSGYGFIMYQAHGTEKAIRKKFKYESLKSKSTNYLTKFYLKQLRTQSLFFGREWDAGPTRFDALSNFVNSVKTEFKSDN